MFNRRPLLESLSPRDAKLIFQRHGATPIDLANAAALKAARIKLIRANDPNQPNASQTAAQEINAAYDVLKVTVATTLSPPATAPPSPPPPSYEQFKSMGYFVEYFAQRATRDSRPCTLRNYDGVNFGHSITIVGSPARYNEMAHAMIAWSYRGRAIFVQYDHLKLDDQRHQLHLIYLDGRFLDGSFVLEFDSYHREPKADLKFMRRLPKILDVLSASGNF